MPSKLADGVHVGHEVVLPGQRLGELDLQVAPRLADANPIILGEPIEQLHARLQHAVPAIPLRIVKTAVPVGRPFPVKHRGGILPLEVGSHRLLEGPTEEHGCPSVFLFPAIEVAMLVAARAGQILADLRVAVSHEDTSDPRGSLSVKTGELFPPGRRREAVEVEDRDAVHRDFADLDHAPQVDQGLVVDLVLS